MAGSGRRQCKYATLRSRRCRAIEIALQHAPDSRRLRLERALLLEQQGRRAESLAELESLAREAARFAAVVSPSGARAAVRRARRRSASASSRRRCDAGRPTRRCTHSSRELRWQRGAGERVHAAARAGDRQISRASCSCGWSRPICCATPGFAERALALVRARSRAARRTRAAFLTSIGVLLDDLDRPDEALPYLRAAVARAPRSAPRSATSCRRCCAPAQPRRRCALCDELLARHPDDQQLIAYRATALRLLGDPVYAALHDYARLVRTYRLQPPAGFRRHRASSTRRSRASSRACTAREQRPLAQIAARRHANRAQPAGRTIR